tara:strand:+ start:1953 stop:2963 length:1011 start_codon:yes stop_codon:yes gene_type:complete
MDFLSKKYSGGQGGNSNSKIPFKNVVIGIVDKVGKVQVSTDNDGDRQKDLRFNADRHAIRVRLIGAQYDNDISNSQLPNCFPLLPKHLNIVPKEKERVIVFIFGEDEKFADRFYIGPITSSEDKLNFDGEVTSMANMMYGLTHPGIELGNIIKADGIYENPQNVVIEGRDNTDIIQRSGEVLIRAGKFVEGAPLIFNYNTPGFIQIKTNMSYKDDDDNTENVTVTNIVSDRINLLTYKGSPKFDNLTIVNKDTRESEYINNETLQDIIDNAHPLVFGDTLVQYLKLLKSALVSHVHNGCDNPPTDRTDKGTQPLNNFVSNAEQLEKAMLSDNIRIN